MTQARPIIPLAVPAAAGPPVRQRSAAEAATTISRREFIVGTVVLAGASALVLGGCSVGAPPEPKPPNVWAPVSITGLVPEEPQWVEFDVSTLPLEAQPSPSAGSTSGSSAASSAPVTPSPIATPVVLPPGVAPAEPVGSPADSVPASRGAAWLVREADGSVVAFVPFCTHQLCLYDWDALERDFHCRCHEGRFSLSGSVTKGPPPRPLWRCETRPTTDPSVIEVGWYRKV